MQRVLVSPTELWDYYVDNKDDLVLNMHMVAENPDYGVTIYVQDNEGVMVLSVYSDDDLIDEKVATLSSCESVARQMYTRFLSGKFIEDVDTEDLIYEREDELSDALDTFLDAVLGAQQSAELEESTRSSILEGVLQYLHDQGFSVYRPMYLEDENGCEFLDLYPYEVMVSD